MVMGSLGEMNVLITATDRATPEIARVQSKMGGLGGAATTAATAIAGVGVAAGAAGAASVAAFANFESQMVEVQKVTGMSDEKLQSLGDTLQSISSGPMPASSSELGKIAAQAGSVGIRGEEAIAKFTKSVQKMAVATRLSSSEAAEQLARISNAFEIPTSKAENLGSTINALSNQTSAWSDEVSQALRRVAPAANTLGVSMQEASGAVATLISKGVPARRAGTKMRRVFQMMSTETAKMAKVVGVSTEEMRSRIQDDAMGALQDFIKAAKDTESVGKTVTEVFGAIGSSAVANLTDLDSLNKNIETANKAYKNGTSLQKEYQNALDTTSVKFENLKNKVVNAGISIGEELAPQVNTLLTNLQSVVPQIEDFGVALASGNFGKAGDMMASFGRSMIESFNAMISSLTSRIKSMDFSAIGAAFTDKLTSVISGSGGGGQLLSTTVKNLSNFFLASIDAVTSFVKGMDFSQIGTAYQKGLTRIFEFIGGSGSQMVGKAVRGLLNTLTSILNGLTRMAKTVNYQRLGQELVTNLFDGIVNVAKRLGGGQGGGGIKKFGSALIGFIGAGIKASLKMAAGLLKGLGKVGAKLNTMLGNWLENNGPAKLGKSLANMVGDAISGLMKFMGGGEGGGNFAATALDIVVTLVQEILKLGVKLSKASNQLVAAFIKGLAGQLPKLKKAAQKHIWTPIKNKIMGLVDGAKGWAKDMIGNFVDGLTNKVDAAKDKIKDSLDTIKGFFGGSPPEYGPLYEAWKHGPEGFVDKYRSNLESAMNKKPLSLRVNEQRVQGSGRSGGQTVVIEEMNINEVENAEEISRRLRRELQRAGVN